MSVQHIALVLEAADLCAQEKAVLTAFCNHTDPNGKTFAGEERLMREAGMPRSTFQRWRSALAKRELLFSRRKGRKGGGRTTSDTYVNLAALRAMRDPFFGNVTADRPDDENPFSQVDSNGPASGAKGATRPSNGPASEGINGPASGAEPAPPVGPITLPIPQGEPSTPSPAPTASAAPTVVADQEEGEGDPLLKNDTDPAAASMAQRLPGDMTQIQRQRTAARVAKLIGAGWGVAALERELTADLGGVRSHFGVYKKRLDDLGDIAPVADTEAPTDSVQTDARRAHAEAAAALAGAREDARLAVRDAKLAEPQTRDWYGLEAWIKGASLADLRAFSAAPTLAVLDDLPQAPPRRRKFEDAVAALSGSISSNA